MSLTDEKRKNIEDEVILHLSKLGINSERTREFLNKESEKQKNVEKEAINMMKELGINETDIIEFIKTEKDENHKELKKQQKIKEEDKALHEEYKKYILNGKTPHYHKFVTETEGEIFNASKMYSGQINIIPTFEEWKVKRQDQNRKDN